MGCSRNFVILLWLLLLLNVSLSQRIRKDLVSDCIPKKAYDASSETSFFGEDFRITGLVTQQGTRVAVADDFDVLYSDTYKIVQNFRVNETYVLYLCGTEIPNVARLDRPVKVFEVPLTSVALYDGTSAGFLKVLGVEDRVTYASEYSVDACFQKTRDQCGRVAQDPTSKYANKKMAQNQERATDAIFHYSATKSPKTIAFTSTMDPSAIKRAEWIKFVSLFFNKEPEANLFFEKLVNDWNDLKVKDNGKGPIVAWINYQSFAGNEFVINNDRYKLDFIEGAGGRSLDMKSLLSIKGIIKTSGGALIKFSNTTSASKILSEAIKDADIVIDETYAEQAETYDLSKFLKTYGLDAKANLKFLKNKKVFRVDGLLSNGKSTDSLDWFENAVARPDLVLKDFLAALGIEKDYKRIWLRNIALNEKPVVIEQKSCKIKDPCNIKPKIICPSVTSTCSNELVFRDPKDVCRPLIC